MAFYDGDPDAGGELLGVATLSQNLEPGEFEDLSVTGDSPGFGPAQVYVEFYNYSIQQTSSMFCAVGSERGELRMHGEILQLAIRTSRIYCRQNGRWQQLHHHGSMDNPQLLVKYQTILLEK